jgi:hypothetical protein
MDEQKINNTQWGTLFTAMSKAINKTEWGTADRNATTRNILASNEVMTALKASMDTDFNDVYKPKPLGTKGWRVCPRAAAQTLIIKNDLQDIVDNTCVIMMQNDGAPWNSKESCVFMRFKCATRACGLNPRIGCKVQDPKANVGVCAYLGHENREVCSIDFIIFLFHFYVYQV